MNRDKYTVGPLMPPSSTFCIQANDSRALLIIHSDGRVTGEIEDASEAARLFVKRLRGYLPVSAQSDALVIANERKAIAAWLRGEVETDYTDPEYDIGRNLADAIERGAYLQEQSK